MLDGFERRKCVLDSGVEIVYWLGGAGPPLLLLHGYPQTHVMWAKLAPALAQSFTVVLSDLRGYGDSSKPESDPGHGTYSFRAMAADQAALMESLGFDRYAVAGHDRGARVTHRLCLDYPGRVCKAAVLDVAPTLTMYEATDMDFAMAYYHWFFLTQPAPLPERLIGADPRFYLRSKLAAWTGIAVEALESVFEAAAIAEYERCFREPATIHSTCEDYRAAASVDLEHDRADRAANRKIACPLLVLWGERGLIARTYDVLGVWRQVSDAEVSGATLPSGHFLAEEAPNETRDQLQAFFA